MSRLYAHVMGRFRADHRAGHGSAAHEGFAWMLGAVLVCVGIVFYMHGDLAEAFAQFPWTPIAIFVALELYTGLVAQTGLFDKVALKAAELSKGSSSRLIIAFSAMLMLLGLVNNNLTALVIAFPILLPALRSTRPSSESVRRTMSALLAAGNCAGAATPIGDFPAIMIMASGLIGFGQYLVLAFPLFLVTSAAVAFLHAGLLKRSAKGEGADPLDTAIELSLMCVKARNREFDKVALYRLAAVFAVMVVAWIALPAAVVPPVLIAWAGLAIATVTVRSSGLEPLSTRFDLDPVVRLGGIYFAASLVATTPLMDSVTQRLVTADVAPGMLLLAVAAVTMALSAVIDAGGATAALLPVLAQLTTGTGPLERVRPIVIVAFAAAICAGSSVFLTSATAGHLMASKVRSSGLVDSDGRPITFGFSQYFVPGLVNAAVQAAIAVAGVAALLFIWR